MRRQREEARDAPERRVHGSGHVQLMLLVAAGRRPIIHPRLRQIGHGRECLYVFAAEAAIGFVFFAPFACLTVVVDPGNGFFHREGFLGAIFVLHTAHEHRTLLGGVT